jgi:hypothetical protein
MTTNNTAPTRPGPATKRLDAEAIALAQDWVAIRKEVRARLIAMARANHPENTYRDFVNSWGQWTNNTVRKLYRYPTDLTDERLLQLATTTEPPA